MRKKTQITQEDFNNLLEWFSSDRDEAAQKYEEIRIGLIKFFSYRGCPESESLADETINRVAKKHREFDFGNDVKLITYFYSFASKIYLEDYSERKRNSEKMEKLKALYRKGIYLEPKTSPAALCLEKCLADEVPGEKRFLLKYYSFEKNEKSESRRKMADELKINIQLLHTKISRLKKTLRGCLKKCLNEKKL
jgi:hypothetical protein